MEYDGLCLFYWEAEKENVRCLVGLHLRFWYRRQLFWRWFGILREKRSRKERLSAGIAERAFPQSGGKPDFLHTWGIIRFWNVLIAAKKVFARWLIKKNNEQGWHPIGSPFGRAPPSAVRGPCCLKSPLRHAFACNLPQGWRHDGCSMNFMFFRKMKLGLSYESNYYKKASPV